MSVEASMLIGTRPHVAPVRCGGSLARPSRCPRQLLRQRPVRYDETVVVAELPGRPKQSVWSRLWRRRHRNTSGLRHPDSSNDSDEAQRIVQEASAKIAHLPEHLGARTAIVTLPTVEGWDLDEASHQAGSALLSAMALGLVYGVATGMLGILLRFSTPSPPVAVTQETRRLPQATEVRRMQQQQQKQIVPMQQQSYSTSGRSAADATPASVATSLGGSQGQLDELKLPVSLVVPGLSEVWLPATWPAELGSMPVVLASVAQLTLYIGASLLKIAALALPALVEFGHWLGVNVIVPLGQVLLHSGADAARDSASVLASRADVVSPGGSTEEAASAVLAGTAASMDLLASAAPAIENAADYIAEKATPVAQEVLRATSRLALDVSRQLEVP